MWPNGVGLLLIFQDLHCQAHRGVECYVTVHKPGAGVVCLECDDDEAVLWEKDHVPSRRIVACQIEGFWGVWYTLDLLQ